MDVASGLGSTPNESSPFGGIDVPAIILAISFGLSLYLLHK
jgi:hypothetical protein